MKIFDQRRRMTTTINDVPIGIRVIQKIGTQCGQQTPQVSRVTRYRTSVLFLTYLCYICYHLTRKPISVVKSVLHRNCSEVQLPAHLKFAPNESTWCDYPPFDGEDSAALLGYLDSAFLFSYGSAMFVSGLVAERVSLRYFLTFGMLLSAIFTYMFGIAKTYDWHSIWYFVAVQALAGICQTTGWPGVVTVVGRWFDKSKRGLIFGIWNSHMSIGNILGSLIAAYYVESDWALSFIVPALIMGVIAMIIFLFLVDSPDIVGCQERPERKTSYKNIESGINSNDTSDVDDTDIIIGEQDNNTSIRSIRGSVNSPTAQYENKVDGHQLNHNSAVPHTDSDKSSSDRKINQIDSLNHHIPLQSKYPLNLDIQENHNNYSEFQTKNCNNVTNNSTTVDKKLSTENNEIFGSTENELTKLTSDSVDKVILKSENSITDNTKTISNSNNHIDALHLEKHNRSSSVSIDQTNTSSTDVSPIDNNDQENLDRDNQSNLAVKNNTRINNDIANNYTIQTNNHVDNTKYTDQPYDIQEQANHIIKKDQQEISYRPNEHTPMLDHHRGSDSASIKSAIGFVGALKIPGVIEFSLCLFFSKLVSYTFLYWLPLYIQSSTTLGAEKSADLSTLFDVGGIVGAITAGLLSDYTGMSACTCSVMLVFAVPMLLIYQTYGTVSLALNIFLLFIVGILVNGPYALITTAVSAELGTHSSLEGNSKALATVAAIIDGTGSIGAAVGPLLAGLVSSSGWQNVFYMLMISDVIALLLLIRLVTKELSRFKRNPRID